MGDRLFAGSCSGSFFAFDRWSGETLWAYDTSLDGAPANFHGEPLVTDELIVVGSDLATTLELEHAGHVYAFEQATGNLRWKYDSLAGVISELVRRGDTVYGVTTDGELLALGLDDGRHRFSVRPQAEGTDVSLRFSAVLHDGRVVFTAPGGSVVAVDAGTGEPQWDRTLDAAINTTLVPAGDSLFVGTRGNTIYRLDASTGEVRARHTTTAVPYGTPVVLDDALLVLVGGSSFVRLELESEHVRWSRETTSEWTSFRPLLLGNRVLVGDEDGELLALDLETGEVRATWSFPGGVRGFSVVDSVFYIGTLRGKLYARAVRDDASPRPGEAAGLPPLE